MSIQKVRSRYLLYVKFGVLVVVTFFIARRAFDLWTSAPQVAISINVFWLIPAALVYFAGWIPSVWLWMAMLRAMHQAVDWRTAMRAYYVSHLGKYVPGKALALVIRGAMVEKSGVSPMLAGVTGGCETLVYMATGIALFIGLSPFVFSDVSEFGKFVFWPWCHEQPFAFAVIVAAATLATTPLSAWLFTRLCRKSTPGLRDGDVPFISAILVSEGVCATTIGWALHALSLGFVVQSVSNNPFDLTRFPVWMAASTLSIVGGFVVLVAPGGLGVREGLLIEILKEQPQIGAMTAIVVAALLRATWFLTELVAASVAFVTTGSRFRSVGQPDGEVGRNDESPG